MQRLTQFDVSRQFVTARGRHTAQFVFGGVCAGAMIGLRSIVDVVASASGPFALIYPTVLLATLYGRLRAGLVALALSFVWAWYFVLPAPRSFLFVQPGDPARVALNAVCAIVVVIFAEAFRRAAHSTVDEIQQAADRRLMLLAEVEHRTKNNFALVAAMLEFQKRRLDDPSLQAHLSDAVIRVRTFADAYSSLAIDQAESSAVAVKPYLETLLDRLQRAAMPEHLGLYREIDPITLPRETAVAIGLYLNEALSNCLKYAFPDDRKGTVGVFFHVNGGNWTLTVDDDGIGNAAVSRPDGGGLGANLMSASAQQAGARHEAGPMAKGFRASITRSEAQVA